MDKTKQNNPFENLPWLIVKGNKLINTSTGKNVDVASFDYYNRMQNEALEMYQNGSTKSDDEALYYIVSWCDYKMKISNIMEGSPEIKTYKKTEPSKKYGYMVLVFIILSILIMIFL